MSLRFLGSESDAVVEHSPPTHVARGSNAGVDAVMCVEFVVRSLPCFERFFSGYFGFSLSSKTNIFQIPIRSGKHGRVSTSCHELLSAPWVPNYNLQLQLQFTGRKAEYFSSRFRPPTWSFFENLVMTLPPLDLCRGIGQPLCY